MPSWEKGLALRSAMRLRICCTCSLLGVLLFVCGSVLDWVTIDRYNILTLIGRPSIFSKIEDDLNFVCFYIRRPKFFGKWKTIPIFSKWNLTLIFWQMEYNPFLLLRVGSALLRFVGLFLNISWYWTIKNAFAVWKRKFQTDYFSSPKLRFFLKRFKGHSYLGYYLAVLYTFSSWWVLFLNALRLRVLNLETWHIDSDIKELTL